MPCRKQENSSGISEQGSFPLASIYHLPITGKKKVIKINRSNKQTNNTSVSSVDCSKSKIKSWKIFSSIYVISMAGKCTSQCEAVQSQRQGGGEGAGLIAGKGRFVECGFRSSMWFFLWWGFLRRRRDEAGSRALRRVLRLSSPRSPLAFPFHTPFPNGVSS